MISQFKLTYQDVGLLQNLLARYDEEVLYIRRNHPSHRSLIGVIKRGIFDYPEPTFNSGSHLLFDKVMSCKNLSYDAAKSFFNSFVFYDTLNLTQNRLDLYHSMCFDLNFHDYPMDVLVFILEETKKMKPFNGKNAQKDNIRLSKFKEQLSIYLQNKKVDIN